MPGVFRQSSKQDLTTRANKYQTTQKNPARLDKSYYATLPYPELKMIRSFATSGNQPGELLAMVPMTTVPTGQRKRRQSTRSHRDARRRASRDPRL